MVDVLVIAFCLAVAAFALVRFERYTRPPTHDHLLRRAEPSVSADPVQAAEPAGILTPPPIEGNRLIDDLLGARSVAGRQWA